jgi:hypothetical protein
MAQGYEQTMKSRDEFDAELWNSRNENAELSEQDQTSRYTILLLVQIREAVLDIRDLLVSTDPSIDP